MVSFLEPPIAVGHHELAQQVFPQRSWCTRSYSFLQLLAQTGRASGLRATRDGLHQFVVPEFCESEERGMPYLSRGFLHL